MTVFVDGADVYASETVCERVILIILKQIMIIIIIIIIITNLRVRLLWRIHQPTPPAKHQVPASLISRFTNRLRLFMPQ